MTETIKRTIHEYDNAGKLVKEIVEEITKEDNNCGISGCITNKSIPADIYNRDINELNGRCKAVTDNFIRVQNEEPRITREGR